MDLILWRHADAEEAGPDQSDGERRLTALGQQQARSSAQWLARHLPETATVLVSPAKRALQTVEPL